MRKFISCIFAVFILLPFSYGQQNVFLENLQAGNEKFKELGAMTDEQALLKEEQASDAEIKEFIRMKMAAYKQYLTIVAKTDSFTDFAQLEAEDVSGPHVRAYITPDGRTVLKREEQAGIIQFLNEKRRAGDYEVLTGYSALISKIPEGTKIIFGGEIHDETSGLAEAGFIIALRKYFNLGHVASEFLTTNLRGGLERFNKTGDLNEITISTNHVLESDTKNAYTASASKGLDIIPLEDVEADFGGIKVDGKINTPRVFDDFLEIQKSGGGLGGFFVSNVGKAARNAEWMTRLQPVLDAMKSGREDKTMFVYGGLGHIEYGAISGSLADRVRAQKLKTVNILFMSEDKDLPVMGDNFPNGVRYLFTVPEYAKNDFGVDFIVLYKNITPDKIVF